MTTLIGTPVPLQGTFAHCSLNICSWLTSVKYDAFVVVVAVVVVVVVVVHFCSPCLQKVVVNCHTLDEFLFILFRIMYHSVL